MELGLPTHASMQVADVAPGRGETLLASLDATGRGGTGRGDIMSAFLPSTGRGLALPVLGNPLGLSGRSWQGFGSPQAGKPSRPLHIQGPRASESTRLRTPPDSSSMQKGALREHVEDPRCSRHPQCSRSLEGFQCRDKQFR